MTDLSKLSPTALKAAMEGGTEAWGKWGSAEHHRVYVEPVNLGRRWRMCRCGCRKRSTHRTAANGVTLMLGCELATRRFAKWLATRS